MADRGDPRPSWLLGALVLLWKAKQTTDPERRARLEAESAGLSWLAAKHDEVILPVR